MDAIVFDMDGVLVDSEPLHLQAANRVLDRYGVQLSDEQNAAFLGMDDRAFFAGLREMFSLEESVADLIAARTSEILSLVDAGVIARPGVAELIVGLKMRGFPMALASSSPRAVVDAMLEALGLEGSFDAVITGDDVETGKPDPAIFLEAARRLGVEPGGCLVIEDALHGVRAARAAGMIPVAVRTRENHHVPFEEAYRVFDGLDRFDWSLLDDR